MIGSAHSCIFKETSRRGRGKRLSLFGGVGVARGGECCDTMRYHIILTEDILLTGPQPLA